MPRYIGKRFVLSGRVQGVGCRAQVLEWADVIGHLSGWVRNLESGDVEVCVKGPDWRVADLERILRTKMLGPVVIERVLAEDLGSDFAPTGFVIRRDV
jgi:acylphosphatase